jgi:hypothetical protein
MVYGNSRGSNFGFRLPISVAMSGACSMCSGEERYIQGFGEEICRKEDTFKTET